MLLAFDGEAEGSAEHFGDQLAQLPAGESAGGVLLRETVRLGRLRTAQVRRIGRKLDVHTFSGAAKVRATLDFGTVLTPICPALA